MHNPTKIASRQNKEIELQHAQRIMDKPLFYWNSQSLAGKRGSLRRAEWIMKITNMKPDMNILEVGCGTGFFSEVFAKSNANLFCIDLVPEFVQKAMERNVPGATFITADIEALPFDSSKFDAVIGVRILHHLDMDASFREIKRVLKPGGCIAFCEPNMMNPQLMIQKNVPWIKKMMGDTPDETAFFKWKMKNFLRKQGFQSIFVDPFDFLHPWLPNAIVEPAEKVGFAIEKIPLLREIAGSLKIFAQSSHR